MKITVVLVTYNRIALLDTALRFYDSQNCIQHLVVVDNASTDGTQTLLQKWCQVPSHYRKVVLRQKRNLGGSYGFYRGLKYAKELAPNWIWVSDDDVFINDGTFPELFHFLSEHGETEDVSALCSTVIQQGRINYWHRRTIAETHEFRIVNTPSAENDYSRRFFPINAFSFVGTLLNKQKVLKAGLPIKDYFIWFDDTEYSLRIAKEGQIYVVPASTVLHGPLDQTSQPVSPAEWRKYYDLRNYGDLIRRHFSKKSYQIYVNERVWQPLKASIKQQDHASTKLFLKVLIDLCLHRLGKRRGYPPRNVGDKK